MAQADAVVVANVGEVTHSIDSTAFVATVERRLFGTVPDRLELQLPAGVTAGSTLLLHLALIDEKWTALVDGTAPHTDKLEASRIAQIAHRPAWPETTGGWSSVLVLEQTELDVGDEVNGWVVLKNTATHVQTVELSDWPRDERTHWQLRVERDGELVAPIPHPHVSEQDIAETFSRPGERFARQLKPGECIAFPLARIGSAKPGWGYKERLGFQYWPLEKPGEYRIWATDHNFPWPSITTPAAHLTLR